VYRVNRNKVKAKVCSKCGKLFVGSNKGSYEATLLDAYCELTRHCIADKYWILLLMINFWNRKRWLQIIIEGYDQNDQKKTFFSQIEEVVRTLFSAINCTTATNFLFPFWQVCTECTEQKRTKCLISENNHFKFNIITAVRKTNSLKFKKQNVQNIKINLPFYKQSLYFYKKDFKQVAIFSKKVGIYRKKLPFLAKMFLYFGL
jgi:hypothetical protein